MDIAVELHEVNNVAEPAKQYELNSLTVTNKSISNIHFEDKTNEPVNEDFPQKRKTLKRNGTVNVENMNLTFIMFCDANLTVNDVLTMCTFIALRFGLTKECRSAVIDMLKICAGPRCEKLDILTYALDKISDIPNVISCEFPCVKCKNLMSIDKDAKLGENVPCAKCGSLNVSEFIESNTYVEVDLAYQFDILLKNERLVQKLSKFFHDRDTRNNDAMQDI